MVGVSSVGITRKHAFTLQYVNRTIQEDRRKWLESIHIIVESAYDSCVHPDGQEAEVQL